MPNKEYKPFERKPLEETAEYKARKAKWDKEQSRIKKDLYNFKYSIALPEDELKKQFYAFNWVMQDTNVSNYFSSIAN